MIEVLAHPSAQANPLTAGPLRVVFHLATAHASYVLAVTAHGHLEQVYWGARLGELAAAAELDAVRQKWPETPQGVVYDAADPHYCLDYLPQDWSGLGKGDYRGPAAEFRQPDGTFVSDFRYVAHQVVTHLVPPGSGVGAHAGDLSAHTPGQKAPAGGEELCTLRVDLADGTSQISLYYSVFPGCDTITRRAVLTHGGSGTIQIRSLMSQQVDLPNRGFDLVTFDGAWISEAHRHVRPVMPGTYVNSSITGFSSANHNPGVMLAAQGATETRGEVYAFNLIYSGNHFTAVELCRRDQVRVRSGINPTGFEWTLQPGESFETPEATLTWSQDGFGGVSQALHRFVNRHVVRGEWAGKERPVLVNNWEATGFDVDHRTVVSMARSARRLGAELFVLDDGWFGERRDERRGLGDWTANPKRFPKGLAALGEEVRSLGLDFGIWVEPEMVNRDSNLFRAHPDWVIATPGRRPSPGRHQLVLDLSRREVRDYIVAAIGAAVDESGASYVKWDCNRNLSDLASATCAPGELAHRYVLGLYEVLGRIFRPRPGVLLETCASGGNRFDLGLLCFGPQIWTSDNTDPIERLDIQLGLSHLYPPSTMGAHVTASPSAQTLRATPLTTRFNVAAFGLLGYELDPRRLTPAERREVREQIAFYKRHRRLFQYGTFRRLRVSPDDVVMSVSAPSPAGVAGGGEVPAHIVGHVQRRARAARPPEALPLPPLASEQRYRVVARRQSVDLADFGRLVEHVLPVPLRAECLAMRQLTRRRRYQDGAESYQASGAALASLRLSPQFEGTGAHAGMRILGDFGSRLYLVLPRP